jgi:hypothetical protein
MTRRYFIPRKLHRGDLIAWAIILMVAAVIFSLLGCASMEQTPPCDPYLSGNTKPQAIGCRP